jgi:ABC-type bacteriocin/lantibiotic exporter with double-glycine peptidase domain
LNADEIDENAISRDPNIKASIKIDSATFKWTKDDSPVLNNISIQVKKKKLVAVVGQVGSGKFILLVFLSSYSKYDSR